MCMRIEEEEEEGGEGAGEDEEEVCPGVFSAEENFTETTQ